MFGRTAANFVKDFRSFFGICGFVILIDFRHDRGARRFRLPAEWNMSICLFRESLREKTFSSERT